MTSVQVDGVDQEAVVGEVDPVPECPRERGEPWPAVAKSKSANQRISKLVTSFVIVVPGLLFFEINNAMPIIINHH